MEISINRRTLVFAKKKKKKKRGGPYLKLATGKLNLGLYEISSDEQLFGLLTSFIQGTYSCMYW